MNSCTVSEGEEKRNKGSRYGTTDFEFCFSTVDSLSFIAEGNGGGKRIRRKDREGVTQGFDNLTDNITHSKQRRTVIFIVSVYI